MSDPFASLYWQRSRRGLTLLLIVAFAAGPAASVRAIAQDSAPAASAPANAPSELAAPAGVSPGPPVTQPESLDAAAGAVSSGEVSAPKSQGSRTKGNRTREKDTEGTEAPHRFEADTVSKSKYELNGQPLEVDPD